MVAEDSDYDPAVGNLNSDFSSTGKVCGTAGDIEDYGGDITCDLTGSAVIIKIDSTVLLTLGSPEISLSNVAVYTEPLACSTAIVTFNVHMNGVVQTTLASGSSYT